MTKVLLVDDDTDFLSIHRYALEAAGFEVETARDADEAFAAATRQAVDVAVLDVVMRYPDEGFTLARRLRRDPRTAHVPLLMLTSVNSVNAARGLDYRFSDEDRDPTWLPVEHFVDKPVSPGTLVGLVRELTRKDG